VSPSSSRRGPVLKSISPEATPEEVAAIVAAVGMLTQSPVVVERAEDPNRLDAWVHVSRLSAHRADFQRGQWRLYGRIGRRARA
jgi:hypothetical protein